MGSSEANRRIDLKLMRKEVFFGPNTFEVSISQMCCYFKDRMKDIAPKKNMSNKTPQQNIMWHDTWKEKAHMLQHLQCYLLWDTHTRNDMFVHEIFPFFAWFEAVLSSRGFSDMSSHPHSIKPPFLSRNIQTSLKQQCSGGVILHQAGISHRYDNLSTTRKPAAVFHDEGLEFERIEQRELVALQKQQAQ